MVAQLHAPDLANHVHGDHLESLLKVSAGQWNTPVNFGSALYGLAGQFWIGTNIEGFKLPEEEEARTRRFINGEIDLAEFLDPLKLS
ncbi:antitoxin VbhA family protein [Rhodoferax koreensis]|uniref:antitoxin VbhA family protein n=1 Tax=Rhodoferax koreensis TaxID=1842727 RepID=UPI0012FF8693|nr:antitoxin VbhA family protein [Rhodoferax koreense]